MGWKGVKEVYQGPAGANRAQKVLKWEQPPELRKNSKSSQIQSAKNPSIFCNALSPQGVKNGTGKGTRGLAETNTDPKREKQQKHQK